MPSDRDPRSGTPVDAVLGVLAPALADFRSMVAEAHEELRAWQSQHVDTGFSPGARLQAELGVFARERVDPARLAALLDPPAEVDPLTHQLVLTASHRYADLLGQGTDAFRVRVPAGGDLRDAVRDGLAEVGRAFALARVVDKALNHGYDPDRDHALLGAFPFHRWNRLEREAAPPLVVEVESDDLRAAGLAEFLDGATRLVLVVRGQVRPAPLARLVSTQLFVAQASGDVALDRVRELVEAGSPGIVGVFADDAGALPFVQRPGAPLEVDGDALAAAVDAAAGTRGQPGILDLRHLEALARTPSSLPAAGPPAPDAKTVDRLAAWLLARTDVSLPAAGGGGDPSDRPPDA